MHYLYPGWTWACNLKLYGGKRPSPLQFKHVPWKTRPLKKPSISFILETNIPHSHDGDLYIYLQIIPYR